MSDVYTLNEFLAKTAQKDKGGEKFQLESHRMLEINVDGQMWTKLGATVAYRGSLKFEREGAFEHGIGKFLKRAVTGEATPLTKVSGKGTLYVADYGKHIMLIKLQGESIHVNGNDLLAFEPTVTWDIKMIKRIAGMLAGGLFCVQLSGTGMIAITSHGEPMTLRCTPADPVYTDPNATIAWSGNMFPDLKTDISFKTLLGRGSGETFQMSFNGDGFVIVQPYEEGVAASSSSSQ
ncbi:MAG: AIM24 family protein [Abditibacteriales bacterium]|nr:AIM24 family protein [Abditibacteriales bacterium]MDW8368053.1 AIM24 family protein [Abditibacteriales bacterium]